MLPFTTPDEPLYLVYAINRVIQVKAGQLEAKLKALTLHLLQRGAPRGNGVIKEDHAAPPFTRGMALVDLNGMIEPETAFRPAPNYMAAMDLNGAIEQDPADEYVSNQDTMLEAKIGKSSGSSSGISIDDVQIIQVFKFLSPLSNQIETVMFIATVVFMIIISYLACLPCFLKADCLAAIALQLLLKLKRHLKIVYSLNDARCQVRNH